MSDRPNDGKSHAGRGQSIGALTAGFVVNIALTLGTDLGLSGLNRY